MTIVLLWWHVPLVVTVVLCIWGIVSPSKAPFGDFFQAIFIFGASSFSWAIAAAFFK